MNCGQGGTRLLHSQVTSYSTALSIKEVLSTPSLKQINLLTLVGKEGNSPSKKPMPSHRFFLGTSSSTNSTEFVYRRSVLVPLSKLRFALVGKEGLEPSSLATLVPKTNAYTNSATCPCNFYRTHNATPSQHRRACGSHKS